ncbi:MAG: SOS response-associated peptidase [Bifidobacteriaceae bacterium]|jgi:putative SOS response-associated peptidase YedK|nr:SOS response-associated peptidase [Bifidobacteriaceae bacterium]
MCGRYANYHAHDIVARAFGIDRIEERLDPSWNVAPTQRVAIVTDDAAPSPGDAPVRVLRGARWGLVPPWVKDPSAGPLLINARSETLTVKPAFRAAASRRRAIVPASGYFEWQADHGRPKVPYYLAPADGGPLGFAGVAGWWRPASSMGVSTREAGDGGDEEEDGPRWLASVAIVTRPAADAVGHIHDRMPVVVPPDAVDAWLDPSLTGRHEVDAMLGAMPPPVLVPRRVSRAVGSVRNNSAALIRGEDSDPPE